MIPTECFMFISKHKRLICVVKKTFWNVCAHPEELEEFGGAASDFAKFRIDKYCHNLYGPAVEDTQTKDLYYYIDGMSMGKEDWEHKAHNILFKNNLDEILND